MTEEEALHHVRSHLTEAWGVIVEAARAEGGKPWDAAAPFIDQVRFVIEGGAPVRYKSGTFTVPVFAGPHHANPTLNRNAALKEYASTGERVGHVLLRQMRYSWLPLPHRLEVPPNHELSYDWRASASGDGLEPVAALLVPVVQWDQLAKEATGG